MDTHSYNILAIFWISQKLIFSILCNKVNSPSEHCSLGEFSARCSNDELILMETAKYGRMAPGTCFPASEGNFGCYSDVRNILDSLCSGRQTCEVPVLHREIIATKPCGSMMGYMTASYKCVKVSNPQNICSNGEITISEPNGILSPGNECDIILDIPFGRLVNVTVYNFMKSLPSSACYEVATVKSHDIVTNVHLCPSDPRIKKVTVISSNPVTFALKKVNLGQGASGGYLISFEATGCARPTVPSDSHLERDGDRAKIRCNDSEKSWFIHCKDNKWTGQDRRCPEKAWTISKIFHSDSSGFPYGVFLTSFIGVGIGIFFGGFLLFLAINAFQRHQRRRRSYEMPPIIPDPDYKIYDTCKMNLNLIPGFGTGGRHTLPRLQMSPLPRHQVSPPPVPSPLSEDERRFSRHTYEKPKYNSTDSSPYLDAHNIGTF